MGAPALIFAFNRAPLIPRIVAASLSDPILISARLHKMSMRIFSGAARDGWWRIAAF
jgi:hypothetical protein